ncbi:ImmA/IrrE family metallo-endopeptidase [Clostridium tarantellae]|uniref:ImmA/IrrE family metallo-endopeptidase n=1 Tax=Clostridium tarantellae TaxID=39493 RepID=A0A6I1MQS6_9CLOT|nr:ImmA/IrrE family metallo-endopeptidase [Clostridium tarantellae]MPQ44592.1 ImmA/IrrE family metallo-endopeptidase [Clostridium tarantellae]
MIKEVVADLVNSHKTNDPLELCELLNIKIMISDLGNEIKGFFQRTPNGFKIIHLNSTLDTKESKYILAHELGHAILHTHLSIGLFLENNLLIKNKYENEADKFAAELLIDDHIIRDVEFSELNVEQICSSLEIPVKLMKLKFNLDI